MWHNIRWRIAIPYVLLIVLVAATLSVALSGLVREAYITPLEGQLTQSARLIADDLSADFHTAGSYDEPAKHFADLTQARVTIIARDGTVLGESQEDRSTMDNHLSRTEVQEAIHFGLGSEVRFSNTAGYEMLYVAVPIRVQDEVVGVARMALPLSAIQTHVADLRRTILLIASVMVILAVILALIIAERTARPVRDLTRLADRYAQGDLDARLFPRSRDELGDLTSAFNSMADQLREKIASLDAERSRLAAVLQHMADGVLISDARGRVQLINTAAARLVGTTEEAALGRTFAEVVRHHRLIELWQRCRTSGQEQNDLVEVNRLGTFVQVIVSPLLEGDRQSCLIMLQDLTQVRRLETIRRDFISNISHELRTPLASLKALVDTLRDGALEDPPAAEHFLTKIEVEVDAMSQMVRELLELSRIESGQVPLRLKPVAPAEMVIATVERLLPQAERAGLTLRTDVPTGLPLILVDAERVQLIVTNLVHNAIKFTPAGGQVNVTASAVGDEVVIAVCDTGVGIPANLQGRIFERFFKADRARSGGGTGLGLAIAKHIVQAHGGRIWVESREGRGSTFSFSIPVAPADAKGKEAAPLIG